MTEFQELVKDAPKFTSMERGELVTYAYAMFAAGTKADSENAKLRELVRDFARYRLGDCQHCGYAEQCTTRQTNCYKVSVDLHGRARKLGIEVD